MAYWAKDGSFVREDSDYTPQRTQGDDWEAQQRVIKGMEDWKKEEAKREAHEREVRAELHEIQNMVQQQRADAIDYERNKQKAVRILVEQNRQNYYDQCWLKRAFDTMRGKSFAHMRDKIEENAINRVDRMSPQYLENFIEKNSEEKGGSRK